MDYLLNNKYYASSIELDLVRIIMELTVIGLVIFVYCYYDIAQQNLYCLIVMVSVFVNLLFSSCLTVTTGWILRCITLGCILYKKQESLNVLLKGKKD